MTSRFAAASIVLACAAVSLGQGRIRILPNGGLEDATGDVDTQTVYPRDSAVAGERLQLAERLEKQKEWNKAADVYQDVAQKYADRVVPVRFDKAGRAISYVSATQTAQDKLAKWPAEGIAAYRKRFEDTARDALAADPGERSAGRVMTLYFLTDAGRDAAMSVMATAFERGDFVTVAGIGRRLLETHPALEAERPRVLLWTGLAEHLAGRDNDAKSRLEELKTKFADATVSVGGMDVKAIERLTVALATPAAPPGRYRSDDWPAPYGTPDAAAVPEQVCVGGARLFSVALPGATRRSSNPQGVPAYRKAQETDRKTGASVGILPAIEGGALYFQDNARIWAVGLSTGLPLPGWAATYPGDKAGCYAIDADPTPRNRQTAVTVTNDSVIALLSQYDAAAANAGQTSPPPQLVCLDKLTGRRSWAVTASALRVPEALANLREGVFYGTPVADETAVYIPLYANRGGQFEESYIVALNLADGAFRWASYVASTSLGNRALDVTADSNTLTIATLSMAGGRLYVATNLGAVACLDAADGRTLWLNVYEKTRQQLGGFVAQAKQSIKPFAFGPPIIADGRVFVLPTDSPNILIFDADDGSPIRTIPRAMQKFTDISTLAGVVDGSLIVANRTTVLRLPWRTYDPAKTIYENGGAARAIPPAENEKSVPDSIRGRVFVSGKSILVPSAERLYRLSTASLQIESTYPATGKWDDEESPGNIVATPENLIIAGATRVTAYADLSVATAKLDQKLAATPNDVESYFRYAELLLAAGQSKPALEKLDTAAAKLGGRTGLTPGPLRDRLFEIAVGFAGKLQRTEPTSATIFQLYDRAASAAATADQQVRYRLGRAAALRAIGRPQDEIALHQQILAEPAWRAVPVAGRSGPSTAGVEAATGVKEILRVSGVALYKDYDRAAFDKLSTLKQSPAPDAAALTELAEAYPLATSAPVALSLAAERLEAAGDARGASRVLRRLLTGDLSNVQRQSALQALARNALRLPNQAAIAKVRLRQAMAIAPEAKLERSFELPDGTRLKADTLDAAIAAIDAYRDKSAAEALPTLGVPLTTGDVSEYKPAFKPAEVVAPAAAIIAQQADVARPNRVVIAGPTGKIGVVDAKSSAITWTDASPSRTPIGCGYVGDLLVLVSAEEVSGVDAEGHVRWTTRVAGLPSIEVTPLPGVEERIVDSEAVDVQMQQNVRRVVINGRRGGRFGRMPPFPVRAPVEDTPPPASEEFAKFRLLSDRVVLTSSTGRILALDTGGKTLWQARVSETAAGRLVSNDDFVAVTHADPAGATTQACAFDAQTGQIVHRKAYDAGQQPVGPLMNLALSPDGVLVTMLAGRLVAQDLYDPGSGERKYDRPNGFGDPLFAQSNVDGQLVVSGDRVLAVVRGTEGRQFVRAFDLRTMRPLTTKEPNGRDVEISFASGSGESDISLPVTLRPAGRAFYVIGQRSFASYSFSKSEQAWTAPNGAGDLGPIRDVMVAKDFVVLVRQALMGGPNPSKLPAINVSMFNRAWLDDLDRENGSLEQRPTIADPSGIEAGEWQVADGAFYYVAGDGKLKVLQANR